MIGALLTKQRVPDWFDAASRHDLDALLKDYAEDVTLVYPGDVDGVSGTFPGKAALRAWYQRYFDQFPVIHNTLKNIAVSYIFDFVGNNVIAITYEVEVVNRDGLEIKHSGVSMVTARRGKATHIEVYMSLADEIFRAAWEIGLQEAQ